MWRKLLISLFSVITFQAIAIENLDASFDELISTPRILENEEDFAALKSQLWSKYKDAIVNSANHISDFNERQISYGDKVMRYSFEQIGAPGENGYPLYIALHGGGAAGPWVNDSQWEHMKVYYRDSVESGIYVAARGVTDTWNLHFVDESYALYDHLITDLVAFANVDPNRVYILGFSAGGDGVYQIANRMPDRFAGANMSAGHSNWIRFDNLVNLPFLLQVGSRDTAYSRHRNAPENALQLEKLALERGGYVHQMYLHANGSHNSWRDNDPSGQMQPIINNVADWLSGSPAQTTAVNTNAVHWLNHYTRNPHPQNLYWDYEISAQRDYAAGAALLSDSNRSRLSAAKNLFYWLNILDGDQSKANVIHAQLFSAENHIRLSGLDRINHLKILLRPDMMNFAHPITLNLDGIDLPAVKVSSDIKVMARTLLERGDPNYVFSAEVELKRLNGNWTIATIE